MMRSLFFCPVVVLVMLSAHAATALEPLPTPRPLEPSNKKEIARFAPASDISGNGYFLYASPDGIAISPIRTFAPQIIPNTSGDAGSIDISDDGTWIVFSDRDEIYLIHPDGSGKTVVPAPADKPRKTVKAAGFYHHGPLGQEVVFLKDSRTVAAIAVDLSGLEPKFGDVRTLADMSGVEGSFAFAVNQEQRLTVASDRMVVGVAGHAGALHIAMITLPDNGRGTATGKDVFNRLNAPKWECGPAMSHNGQVVAQNPGGKRNPELLPTNIGHKGPVVYPFYRSDHAPLKVEDDLYLKQALAICWVPAAVADAKGDWHHWFFSNDPAYIIGTNQGERGNKGKVEDFQAIGIYLLHWPSGTYHRLSDERTRSTFMACHFFRTESRDRVRLPAGFGSATKVSSTNSSPNSGRSAAPEPPVVDPIVLEVTAVELSSVPAPDDIGVYRHVSRFVGYRVDRVVKGTYESQTIAVGHWSVSDGKFTPAARYVKGQRLRLKVVPMNDQDEITLARTIDELEDLEAQRYWAVEATPLP